VNDWDGLRQLLLTVGSYVPLLTVWAVMTIVAAVWVADRRVAALIGLGTILHVALVGFQLVQFVFRETWPGGAAFYFLQALFINGLQAVAWGMAIVAALIGRTSSASSPPASASMPADRTG
jgi:hypothetical protein